MKPLSLFTAAAILGAAAVATFSAYLWRERCLEAERKVQYLNAKLEQLQSDVCIALGNKPENNTWTLVSLNGGGWMQIVFFDWQWWESCRWTE